MLAIVKDKNQLKDNSQNIEYIQDIDTLIEKASFFEIEPQEIIEDCLEQEQKETLTDLGFVLINLNDYLANTKEITEVREQETKQELQQETQQELQQETQKETKEETSEVQTITKQETAEQERPEVQTITKDPQVEEEKTIKKTTLFINNESTNKGFFRNLFSNNKNKSNDSQEELVSFKRLNRMNQDLGRGSEFKTFLKKTKLMTEEQIKDVEKVIDKQRSVGVTVYFIQVALAKKYLTEEQAINILSQTSRKEIIPLSSLSIEELKINNNNILLMLSNFVIWKIDKENHSLILLKDLATSEIKTDFLEEFYLGYTINTKNMIDGSIKKILTKIKN